MDNTGLRNLQWKLPVKNVVPLFKSPSEVYETYTAFHKKKIKKAVISLSFFTRQCTKFRVKIPRYRPKSQDVSPRRKYLREYAATSAEAEADRR